MKWERYSSYEASGIKWLKGIPSHWKERKLKYIASVVPSNVDKHSIEGERSVYLCNYIDVYNHDHITPELNLMRATASPDEIEKFKLKKGNVLVTKDSEDWHDIAVPAYITSDMEDVLCGYHLAKIQARDSVMDGEYLFRAFSASGLNDQFMIAATGITRYGLGKYWLDNALFPVPPREEQKAIITLINIETEHIDTLISKKQRQIELLQEKRSALISHVVTKGLNPNAKMKDSGIEWLDEIPYTWCVKRLKHITPQITVGIVITPSKYYVDSGVPCLRSLNVKEDMLTETDLVFISSESNELLCKSRLYFGDLVAVRTGQPGTTAVVDERFEGANCIDLIIIRKSPKFDSRFMCYVMNSEYSKTQYLSGSSGAIQSHFNIETSSNMMIAVPPVDEQIHIRDYLDKEIGGIKVLVQKIELSISKLHEYRTALISAAVTGKIDVRKEVA
jgi:type I restriction enzyme S subunit